MEQQGHVVPARALRVRHTAHQSAEGEGRGREGGKEWEEKDIGVNRTLVINIPGSTCLGISKVVILLGL